jgi:hypothetical protein
MARSRNRINPKKAKKGVAVVATPLLFYTVNFAITSGGGV